MLTLVPSYKERFDIDDERLLEDMDTGDGGNTETYSSSASGQLGACGFENANDPTPFC